MFQIGEFIFSIVNHDSFEIPKNMLKFRVDRNDFDVQYDIYVCDKINIEEENFLLNKNNIKIIKKNDLEKRYLFIQNDPTCYGVSEEIDEKHTQIYVHKDYVSMMVVDTMFASLLSLERKMFKHNCFVLHSASIHVEGHTILFSAPSGTGKSTQASLWEKYRHAHVINGDRSLLQVENDQVYACGWPICGSSEICHNEKHPITCIVFLSQAKENKIERLSYKDSFKKLISEMTINYHNPLFVNQAMDFIEILCQHTPVYHLACDISEEAVNCLYQQLNEDQLWMHSKEY